jgi:nicotinate-nucleotide pyrophosphorylase
MVSIRIDIYSAIYIADTRRLIPGLKELEVYAVYSAVAFMPPV